MQGLGDAGAAASGELAIDRQLAQQYGESGPALLLDPVEASLGLPASSAPVPVPAFNEEAARRLEQEIDAALAEAAAQKSGRPVVRTAEPEPWSTAAVVSGAVLLFALVCLVLTLAVRELRADAKQRRRNYRRRVRRRHAPVDTAVISAS
jgi:plasmid stabilization system protein ParE